MAAASTFCPECGAGLKEGSEGSDEAVYQELTQANLARTRGKPEEGVEICLGVLRRYPNNASAHILLGDIYADANDLPKAAEWYEMAVDLAPDSAPAKEKLQRVRDRLVQREAALTAKQLGIPQRSSQAVLYVVGVAALIILVGAASFLLGSQIKGEQDDSPLRVNNPVVLPGSPERARVDTMLPGERALLRAMKQKSTHKERLVSVLEDPREPSLTVTVRGEKDVPVEVAAANAVIDAFEAAPAYRRVTVRVVVSDQTVLVGDVTADAYAAAKQYIQGTDLSAFAAQVLPAPWTPAASVSPKSDPAAGQ
ncbi:MAG: tetratricopeptide repeat protein [Armatimonadetes bacterium]|nr:tetratricopeptide repeat protein [Armatimonadota bacterium]